MSIVLITGPTGFLGRHCLDRLLSEDCEIHAVSRRHKASGGDRAHWHAADLRDPAQAREPKSAENFGDYLVDKPTHKG